MAIFHFPAKKQKKKTIADLSDTFWKRVDQNAKYDANNDPRYQKFRKRMEDAKKR